MTFRSIFVILIITTLALTIVVDQEAVFGSGKYVGSIKGECYHNPNCRYVKNINDENRIEFADECDAVDRGYRRCEVCTPPECQLVSQEAFEQETTSSAPAAKTTAAPKTTATQTSESKKTTPKEITPTPESTSMTTSSGGGSLIVPAVSILGLAAVGGYILKRRNSQAKMNVPSSEA